jgi:hypothetical protein
LDARLLHFIFLFNFTETLLPSQAALALSKFGIIGSVILADPPPNDNEYPLCESLKWLINNQ